jgi:hypothetical protein
MPEYALQAELRKLPELERTQSKPDSVFDRLSPSYRNAKTPMHGTLSGKPWFKKQLMRHKKVKSQKLAVKESPHVLQMYV